MTREFHLIALRQDLVRVARLCDVPEGHAPSVVQYKKHGRHSIYRVEKMCGLVRWTQAVARLGLEETPSRKRLPKDAVREDLLRVAALEGRRGKMPRTSTYRKIGRYSELGVLAALTPPDCRYWWRAAEEVGLEAVRGPAVTRKVILADYRRVAKELGYEPGSWGPTIDELNEHARYTHGAVAYRFGTWGALVEAAGFVRRPDIWDRDARKEQEAA